MGKVIVRHLKREFMLELLAVYDYARDLIWELDDRIVRRAPRIVAMPLLIKGFSRSLSGERFNSAMAQGLGRAGILKKVWASPEETNALAKSRLGIPE